MVLVDTSVWVGHLRGGSQRLAELLRQNLVLMHPSVLGELACGNLRNRKSLLALLAGLPTARTARDAEVLYFIERHALMGQGIGYVDAHLLAATVLNAPATLWTADRPLRAAAGRLKLALEWP